MAEVTQFVCDGCLKPATTRKPVGPMTLTAERDGVEPVTFDAHDTYCWTRAFRRGYREAKEAASGAGSSKAASKK